MATLLLSNVIAAANPFWGAVIGLAGSMIDQQLFGPGEQHSEGQRMDTLSLQDSSYGKMIPIGFGKFRATWNIIWASNFVEHSHTEETGGKGGGGGSSYTTYSYTISIAGSLHDGPIRGVTKLWADGTAYVLSSGSSLDDDTVTFVNSTDSSKSITCRIYRGMETQMPDSFIESYNGGPGSTPAYRGLAYILFRDLNLELFGGRIPQMQFEIVTSEDSLPFRSGTWPELPKIGVSISPEGAFSCPAVTGAYFAEGSFKEHYGLETIADSKMSSCYLVGNTSQNSIVRSTFQDCDFRYFGNPDRLSVSACTVPAEGTTPIRFDPYSHNIKNSWFDNCTFTNCNFKGAYPGYAYNCKFVNCNLSNVSFGTLIRCEFVNCNIRGSYINQYTERCKFTGCNMQNVTSLMNLAYCTFTECDLSGLKHLGFSCWGDTFDGCVMRECVFQYDIYGSTDSDTGQLRKMSFRNTDLRNSEFIIPDWRWASPEQWPETNIRDADFTGADLRGTKFQFRGNDDVRNVIFDGSKLHGTALCQEDCRAQLQTHNCSFVGVDLVTPDPGYSRMIAYNSNILMDIITYLAQRIKIPLEILSFTGLADIVDGYVITEQTTFRSAVESLQLPYFFDALESDDRLKFISRNLQTPSTIPEDDWGAARSGEDSVDKLTVVDGDVLELPAQVNIKFFDYDRDYQVNTVYSRRMYYSETTGDKTITLPIVMSAKFAQQLSEEILAQTWINNVTYTGQLSNKWSKVEPADVIKTTVNSIERLIQVNKVSYDGGLVKIEGKGFKTPEIKAIPQEVPVIPMPSYPGLLSMFFLDLPLLSETDGPGFYVAATADDFQKVALYKSSLNDGTSYSLLDTIGSPATAGTASNALGDGPVNFFDELNTVTVVLKHGTLAGLSKASVLNGGNPALLGDEVIQFRSAELIAANTYKLSGLLRGRRGTEWATTTHQANERFLLLNTSFIKQEQLNVSDIGRPIDYRCAYMGYSDATDISFTSTGAGYLPYAVCHVKGDRDAEGNLKLSWKRRTRIGGNWRAYVDAPLSETAESYQVEIVSGTQVVRTFNASAPEVTYAVADQRKDLGGAKSAVKVRIYQMSEKVGRGRMKEVTV